MSKNVCLVLPCNTYVAPFYYRYEDIMIKYGVDFDLIVWNRANIEENTLATVISFDVKDESNNNDKKKVIKFIKFALFVRKIVNINKYKKIIFLSSYAGNAILLSHYIKAKYKYKYWFDVRDYTYEWFTPYYWLLKQTINNSFKTCLSSDGFKSFLPDHDYLTVHNIDKTNIDKAIALRENIEKSDTIRISFIGNVRYYDENIMLLNAFKNDKRFILQYYGAGSEQLSDYCNYNNIANVKFVGRFSPELTAKFYAETDIINNVYGNVGIEVRTALSNKLYFSASLRIPIIVSPGTYMADITNKYGFGFAVDFNSSCIADELYAWYTCLITSREQPRYNELWDKVQREDELFECKLHEFLSVNN